MDDPDGTETMTCLNSSFPHNTTPKQLSELKSEFMDLPGSPVVKALHFHCRGTGLILCQGTKIQHVELKAPQKEKKVSRTAKSFVILYTNNELLEREMKKIIPFTIASPSPLPKN